MHALPSASFARLAASSIAAALCLAVPAIASAQQPPPQPACDEIPSEPTSFGEPTGFRIVIRQRGDVSLDACHAVRAEKAQKLRGIAGWKPGDPIPHGFHAELKPRLGLVRAGGISAGVAYAASVITGVAMNNHGAFAAIPLVGPFIAAGAYRAPSQSCSGFGCIGSAIGGSIDEAVTRAFLITGGAVQVVGAGLLIAGFAAPKWRLLPDEGRPVTVMPIVGQGTAGFGVVGQF